jgi:cytochrome c-type biogenesis protein CcmE
MLNKLLIIGALALAASAAACTQSGDMQYYEMVDKVAASPEDYIDKDLKLHGWVVAGSINEGVEDQKTVRTFKLEKGGKKIEVRFVGPKPDNLKDRAEVVAHGKLTKRADGSLLFEAAELMAKCPSKYQGATSNKDVF